jgi:hypothetical protein
MSVLFGFGFEEYHSVWLRAFGDSEWGTDCDGWRIKRSDYGKETSYGWEIDHVLPTALGGADHWSNKRPRHSRGNASAGGLLGALLSR